MTQFVTLRPDNLRELRTIDPRMVSYNVEMTEVTGGTFWRAYTPGQIAGTEAFPTIDLSSGDPSQMMTLMQYYEPIDLKSEKLRRLAGALGPAWVRVSGTWATKTYYDFDGHTGGNIPQGYGAVLTREQWLGVLDFVRAVGGRLLVSVANCEGLHAAGEPWNPSQAEQLFALSKACGVPVEAAEFMNEPNMLTMSGAPAGYTGEDYIRDQDLFVAWLRENYPECLVVGPCSVPTSVEGMPFVSTETVLDNAKEKLDVFSYHCYNGISERLACMMPDSHWSPEEAGSEAYLAFQPATALEQTAVRDKYCPGAQMWVTETGDAGGGGDTWASTYLDVLRTVNEFGTFPTITDGVLFHNTLASSDYGYLAPETFQPRPSYFAALLWNRVMGTTVYDAGEPIREGAHVFAHSRRDGRPGTAWCVLNNSVTDATQVELPQAGTLYLLTADSLHASVMKCNGRELVLDGNNALPDIQGEAVPAGVLTLPAASAAFILL